MLDGGWFCCLLVTFPHRLSIFLYSVHVLEAGREREAESFWKEEGAQSPGHSEPSKQTERNYFREAADFYQIFPNNRSHRATQPGHGAAGPHRRGPDGGWEELGGVDVGHVEGCRHCGLGTEGQHGEDDSVIHIWSNWAAWHKFRENWAL